MGMFPIQLVLFQANEGSMIANIIGVLMFSCYTTSLWIIEKFNQMIDEQTDELSDQKPVLIVGNFNTWTVDTHLINPREEGRILLETLTKFDVDLSIGF